MINEKPVITNQKVQLIIERCTRKINSGQSIKYKNKIYIPISDKVISYSLKSKINCMVIEMFDGGLYINVLVNLFITKKRPKHEKYSKEFDDDANIFLGHFQHYLT